MQQIGIESNNLIQFQFDASEAKIGKLLYVVIVVVLPFAFIIYSIMSLLYPVLSTGSHGYK